MKALHINAPHNISVEEVNKPQITADEVLIKVKACGLCGTDVHILEGGFVAQYPLIPGHEFAGEVVEVGSSITRFAVGDKVAVEPNIPCNNCDDCLSNRHHFCENMQVPGVKQAGGFAEYVAVKEHATFNIGNLSFGAGAMVEPVSCVVHSVERLAPEMGDRVLIMGAGPIGLMLGRVLALRGVSHIDYLERTPYRVEKAKAENLGEVFTSVDDIPADIYNCVADATGSGFLTSKAVNDIVMPTGKVLIFGVPTFESKLELNHFNLFKKEITLMGSYTSIKNSIQAIAMLESGRLQVEDLLTELPLEQIPEYMQYMKTGEKDFLKAIAVF